MICSIHQWMWIRARESGRPPPAWSGRHLARCVACREAVAAALRAEAALRAAAVVPEAPAGFDVRVMAAVSAEAGRVAGRRPVRTWRAPAWATAAACAVMTAALWTGTLVRERAVARDQARLAMSATVAASDWITIWGEGTPDRLTAPMELEVANLVDDARRAARVLLAGLD